MKPKPTSSRRPFTFWLAIAAVILVGAGLWYVLAPSPPADWFATREETVTPPAPAIEDPALPAAPAETSLPSFDVVRVTRGGTGVIAGRARPNAEVEVLADGELLGETQADGRGEWVLIFEKPLKVGPSELSLISRLPGQESRESDQIVVVVVPERGDGEFFDSGEGVMAVMSPRDGEGPSTILQRPTASVDFGGGLMVETLDYDEDGRATFTGRASARSEVRLYLDNEYLGSVQANDAGRWTFTPEDPIAPGDHALRLDQVIEEGKVQLRIEVPFDRESPLDVTRAEGSIIVQPGNNLWQISRRLYGEGFQYTVIFGLNKEQIKDPDLIYPNQQFTLPKLAPGS